MQAVMSNKLWLKLVYLKRIDCSKVKTFDLTFIIIMYMYVCYSPWIVSNPKLGYWPTNNSKLETEHTKVPVLV